MHFGSLPVIARLTLSGTLARCSGGPVEEGRVRATAAQVVGSYDLKLEDGAERLVLEADGTYTQDGRSGRRIFHHGGAWRIVGQLLGGSRVILNQAFIAASTKGSDSAEGIGDITLNVHRRFGKIPLARNEVAHWYYVRAD